MKITRRFTRQGQDVYSQINWSKRTSRISNPDGSVVFEMKDAEIPASWSQLATDIMVSKYFRKAGVPQFDETGKQKLDDSGNAVLGPEKSARQVIHRLAGCWRNWGERHGYFDTAEDAQAFYDELAYMLLNQMVAPNSPQWFNTGLNFAYNITGPAQGHFYCDEKTGELKKSENAYARPQPHACQPYHATVSTPIGPVPIGEIVTNKLVGLEVFDGSNDGASDGAGTTKVVAVKFNGEKPVFKVVMSNGLSIEATADHQVLAAFDRRQPGQWMRVDQLTPGMRLRVSTKTQVSKTSDDRAVAEAAVAGWLQGDGFVGQYKEGTNTSLTVEFMTINDQEHDFVLDLVGKVFEGVHYHVRSVDSVDTAINVRRIRLYGEKLRPFVEKYNLLRDGEELSIPAAIRTAGAPAQAAYLRSLFQADGTVRLRKRFSNTSDIVLTTVSPKLAADVQTLLLNLGIYSRVQVGTEKRTNRRTPYFVSIGYAQSRAQFKQSIGFISDDKIAKLDRAVSSEFDGKELPALRDESIVRIELVGTQPVYDIQTQSGQYLSNNTIIHNCFIQAVSDDLVNKGGIMDLWVREARLFKYGSGTGSNFSRVRGENEPLSGGGKSSGLMSFLKIGDRAAAAIKSGGTTRRAAKMVCLDLDHPDIEDFVNWKVREELKVAALVEGLKVLPKDQQELAKKMKLKLDYDFNGEAYITVSGQNSNNSVRIPNSFFEALEKDGDWNLTRRIDGKVHKKIKARDLWDQIAFAAWRCADPGVQYDSTINEWHTCPEDGRINASNPCVTGDTRVLTPGGIWRRIDSMIHIPSRLITNTDKQAINLTDGAYPTGQKDVYQLRTTSGYSLKLTANHQVFAEGKGWVEASSLVQGDRVKLVSSPACVHEVGEPYDPRLFQLAGMLLSQANGSLTELRLDRVLKNVPMVESFADYIRAQWMGETDDTANTSGGLATRTIVNRRLISRLNPFIRVKLDGSYRLSDEAFTSGLAAQKHLLRALFSADANVEDNSVVLRSSNAELLEDVQLMLLGFGVKSTRTDALLTTFTLTIDDGSIVRFAKHIAFLPGYKYEQLALAVGAAASNQVSANTDTVESFTHLGKQNVYDLTEPTTSSFVANGITVHNCSEYMFLDDTACNLASLNVLNFWDSEKRSFDTEAYKHGIRLWTVVLEISVLMASFPSESIARLSYQFRTLGLGYANLGAMLMQAGIPYDSEKGRAICAALSSILTGESYATSAEMAKEHGPFAGYAKNRNHMLRVIRNHRRAAYDVQHNAVGRQIAGDYEAIAIKPVGLDATQFSQDDSLASTALLEASRECWDRAYALGEQHGYRNAQTTVIAPTGTIGLLMDCDTTGVEPDFALVKFKKLAGGGYFKIANQSLKPALVNLGYAPEEITSILKYVMGTLSLDGSPHINRSSLKTKGFTDAELKKIEDSLPSMFELQFAFSPWSMGKEFFDRMGIAESEWQSPGFNLLRKLGFKKKQIEEAGDVICGRGTIENAPFLKKEHYPVFDCANKCGRHGERYIMPEGHIRMMAAAQPFITGAISKTINLPNDATLDDIKTSYQLSWELGLKANALYRDGSKLSQPLNIKSDEEIEDDEDENNVNAAREDVAKDVAIAAAVAAKPETNLGTNVAAPTPEQIRVIEKIVERVVERPLRRRLPDTRNAITHKFDVGGHEGYITVGLYPDGSPGEVFITMAKEGSTIGGLMDTIATLVSVALQYGVPVDSLVRKFEHVRFEPNGMTRNADIPFAKSLVDYIFRWMAMEFVAGYRAVNAPDRGGSTEAETEEAPEAASRPSAFAGSSSSSRDDDAPLFESAGTSKAPEARSTRIGSGVVDALSQQTGKLQADAPACTTCGSITVRSGTCYKCLNCGASLGCS
jgi:ribonucleoside-diphosphate reductase alpha chain